MGILDSKRILEEKNTSDATSITALSFTHRALSDVSCLSEFKNLEKLDLSFNNLLSLESLESCVNLKWLSVANNNLRSLKGIESLSKLTVLNAGKNKLKSMNEVETVTSLRALILNDNEISSVSNLRHMKELNTLVLSRNPISSLPESMKKLKSITKLSMSNCKLSSIDLSLTSCVNLKELRLAHNEIMSIPDEFRYLVKLHNLDMGNNLISSWSSVKVLSSLVNLRNLNIQGNPIAEKEKLVKKVKKILPSLHIFNARPIDKISGKERDEKAEVLLPGDEAENQNGSTYNSHGDSGKTDGRKTKKEPVQTGGEDYVESSKISKKKMKKLNEASKESGLQPTEAEAVKEGDKKSKKEKSGSMVIDSAEVAFTEIFASRDTAEDQKSNSKRYLDADRPEAGPVVTMPSKKKKKSNQGLMKPEFLQAEEIGLGGPSSWD